MTRVVLISLLLILNDVASSQTQFWQQTNGPEGGQVYCISCNSVGEALAATPLGLAFSSDQGSTWNSNLALPDERFVTVALNDLGIQLAGTYAGLYGSTNRGLSWFRDPSLLGTAWIYSTWFLSSDTVFVGTMTSVFRSTNQGQQWLQVDAGLQGYSVYDFSYDRMDDIIYAATGNGVYYSTNGGTSWNPTAVITPRSIFTVTVTNAGSIFAANAYHLYRSTDQGNTWDIDTMGFNGTSVACVRTADDNTIFAGGSWAVLRSTNEGNTWTRIVNGYPEGRATTFSLTTLADGFVILGTTEGIFASTDRGNTWRPSNRGFTKQGIQGVCPIANQHVFASTNFSGIHMSTNRGESWTRLSGTQFSGYISFFVFTSTPNGSILGGTTGKIYRSTDWGLSWDSLSMGLPAYAHVSSFRLGSSGEVYANSGSAIFRSTNDGDSWSSFVPRPPGGLNGTVSTFDVATAGSIVAGVHAWIFEDDYQDDVYRSTDAGTTWQFASNGLGLSRNGPLIRQLTASFDGDLFAMTSFGQSKTMLYRSTNIGNSWMRIAFDSSISISNMTINTEGDIFLGGDSNYVSTNKGVSWTTINSGLRNPRINAISLGPDGFLYAATNNGVFRSIETTTAVEELLTTTPVRANLLQNFPNPFNPVTLIQFTLPTRTYITLHVFDILGREVATLANGVEQAGLRSVRFNASGLSSGVYFYRLQAGTYVQTRKMFVIR